MKRRSFLAAGAGGTLGAAAAAFPAPAIARGLREWRMVSRWPASFPDQYVAAERLARRIAQMSDGLLRITVLPPDALGDYKETLDRVRSGEVAMARSLSYDWRDGGWAFDVFTFVPLGMTEFERSVWLQNYGGQALWDGLYADLGVKPLLCGSVGPRPSGGSQDRSRAWRIYRACVIALRGSRRRSCSGSARHRKCCLVRKSARL